MFLNRSPGKAHQPVKQGGGAPLGLFSAAVMSMQKSCELLQLSAESAGCGSTFSSCVSLLAPFGASFCEGCVS